MKHIIDVRETYEHAMGKVEGSINIPLSKLTINFKNSVEGLQKNDKIIVYCRSGHRASLAVSLFEEQGFTNVVNGLHQDHIERNYQ